MDADALAVGVISALVGVFLGGVLGYFLALRAARRQRRHESKEESYGAMFPKIQESIDIMGEIIASAELKLEEGEKAQGLLVGLLRPLWVYGIDDGIGEVTGLLEDFKGKKPTVDLLESVRPTVEGC